MTNLSLPLRVKLAAILMASLTISKSSFRKRTERASPVSSEMKTFVKGLLMRYLIVLPSAFYAGWLQHAQVLRFHAGRVRRKLPSSNCMADSAASGTIYARTRTPNVTNLVLMALESRWITTKRCAILISSQRRTVAHQRAEYLRSTSASCRRRFVHRGRAARNAFHSLHAHDDETRTSLCRLTALTLFPNFSRRRAGMRRRPAAGSCLNTRSSAA